MAALRPIPESLPVFWVLLLLVLQILGARGQDLEVLQTPGPLSLSAGETLTLNCTLTGISIAGGVRWYKGPDRSQQPVYSDKGTHSPRVIRVVPGAGDDFSIRIANIRPEDAGTYYCVKFRAGTPEKEYRSGKGTVVTVIATPSQPSISGPLSRGTSGASATFNCTSDGFAPRDISVMWFKDGSRIHTSPALVLPEGESTSYQASSSVDVLLTDKDVKSQLTCRIRHSTLAGPLQQVFRLGDVLRVPPKVRLETTPPLPVPLNDSVTITCSVEGFYPNDTSLVWLENGRETGPGKAGPVTQNSAGTFSLKNSLEVNATEQKNKTVFTCQVAHNSQPPVTEELTLEVGVPSEENDSFRSLGEGQWLLPNPYLCIGLVLDKIIVASLLLYLFLRKESGLVNRRHTTVSAQEKGQEESPAEDCYNH